MATHERGFSPCIYRPLLLPPVLPSTSSHTRPPRPSPHNLHARLPHLFRPHPITVARPTTSAFPASLFPSPCPRLAYRLAEDDTGRRRDRTFGGRHKLCWRSVRPSLSPTLLALIRCSKPPRSQFFYGPFRSDEPVLEGLYQHALLIFCSCRETLINIDQEVKHIWSCATFFFPFRSTNIH